MKVKVERHSNEKFMLILPTGEREFLPNPDNGWWSRADAMRAKNKLEELYGMDRSKVRFVQIN